MKNINNVSGRSFQELDETEMQGIFGAGDVTADERGIVSAISAVTLVSLTTFSAGYTTTAIACK